ncbi:mechanosensitive ion channel protein MscS [Tistrella bauzanensis]|uniref:Mechanosensitive ion channel protein MscS n=1 Tax=Tistrella bauzanensis TaxID=657419 RepID=A0ABQ1IA83_9PROT|nr:mechanosensitive ion channel domain-containing protein [Tistrella bauzanensis]GGB28072.1 mechanosensitive ion channel protein MscS [Tistrella bauzanensis]
MDRLQTPEWLAALAASMPAGTGALMLLVVAIGLALIAHRLFFRVLRLVIPHTGIGLRTEMIRRLKGPVRLALILLALRAVAPEVAPEESQSVIIARVLQLGVIGLIGWIAITIVQTVVDINKRRYRIDVADNLLARKHRTQLMLLQRVVIGLVVVLTVAAMLMTFPSVRQFGVSLFASAGVAGIIFGLAAQPILSNLIAGIQIAITQPIRLEDAVVVENEWGWVEEITSTYVVIRLWDWRRLVLPLSYFIQQPFQNWTRHNAAIIGSVVWQVDYSMSFERMRLKLNAFLDESKLWDGNVRVLQVIDTTERTVTIRALMSASNSPTAWDLRCEIREKMLVWMQQECPDAMPRLRSDLFPRGHANGEDKGRAAPVEGQEPLTDAAMERLGRRQ